MKQNFDIKKYLLALKDSEGEAFSYDEAALDTELEKHHAAYSNIVVKSLSVLGGLFATIAFIGFLFAVGGYKTQDSFLIFGIVFTLGSIIASRLVNHVFLDTTVISLYIAGYILIIFGLIEKDDAANTILLVTTMAALAGIFTSSGFMMVLLSVLAFNTSIAFFFVENMRDWTVLAIILISAILLLVTTFESKILHASKALNRKFLALQSGYFLSFLICMIWLSIGNNYGFALWVGRTLYLHIGIALATVWTIYKILSQFQVKNRAQQITAYASALVVLACFLYAPYVGGTLWLLLLAYRYGFKVQVVFALLGLVYMIIKFYYDLNLTLLEKSGLLFFPGLLMIGLWIFVQKKWNTNEQV